MTCCVLWFGITSQAQNAIPATGSNATGAGGTVSYTVGQVIYTTVSETSGTITHGVQQPYEISVVTGVDIVDITLVCTVYPNPTTDFLTLKIADSENQNMSYWLYGVGGNLFETKKILSSETQISIGNQVSGIYFLKVISGTKEVKTFKIIKN